MTPQASPGGESYWMLNTSRKADRSKKGFDSFPLALKKRKKDVQPFLEDMPGNVVVCADGCPSICR